MSSFSQASTSFAGRRGSNTAVHFKKMSNQHFKSTLLEEGGHKKEYPFYAFDTVDNYGQPLTLLTSARCRESVVVVLNCVAVSEMALLQDHNTIEDAMLFVVVKCHMIPFLYYLVEL